MKRKGERVRGENEVCMCTVKWHACRLSWQLGMCSLTLFSAAAGLVVCVEGVRGEEEEEEGGGGRDEWEGRGEGGVGVGLGVALAAGGRDECLEEEEEEKEEEGGREKAGGREERGGGRGGGAS